MASSSRGIQIGSAWFQRKINLRPQHRGVHLVTEEILKQVPEMSQFSVGLCHIQSKHLKYSIHLLAIFHYTYPCINRVSTVSTSQVITFKQYIYSYY